MPTKAKHLRLVEQSEKRPVRKPNAAYCTREHLTEKEMAVLLDTLKCNRHGLRDWLIGLVIYRHGLRVSEACDLRWDDIDFSKRTILVRRLKGSHDSTHYLERDELTGLKRLQREQEPKSAYVFVNERGQPFGRFGIGRMIERAGEAAGLPFPVHVHMLRHGTGYALAARGMDTRRLQHFLGHASITNTVRYTGPNGARDEFHLAARRLPAKAALLSERTDTENPAFDPRRRSQHGARQSRRRTPTDLKARTQEDRDVVRPPQAHPPAWQTAITRSNS
jgi:site-specific recombinase XerD